MNKILLPILAAAALAGGLAAPGMASVAGTRAETVVTIKTENGDFWGTVKSTRPLKCANERTVILFKQVGAEQDPSVDKRMASDTASLSGDRYEWSTGNTGLRRGKFYAKVARTPECRPDTSPTVRASSTT